MGSSTPPPPYSPELAPSDYYLFRSMQHELTKQHFHSYEEVEHWLNIWLTSKNTKWYELGIHELPRRWEKVIANNGQYFDY